MHDNQERYAKAHIKWIEDDGPRPKRRDFGLTELQRKRALAEIHRRFWERHRIEDKDNG